MNTVSAPTEPAARRTALALLSLGVLVLAPFTWLWTLDQPFLRASGLTAWVGIVLALALAFAAARVDRRAWVRAIVFVQLGALALFVWGFFGFARLPATAVPQRAVDFTLPDQEGHPVTLASELARGPVLLVFFRGHW